MTLLVDLSGCRPFVKWAGGKTQLIKELDSMIPPSFNRYFEPFIGGGAMFFHLISDRNMRFAAYLSDVNKELITAYRVIKDNVSELIELLKTYKVEYEKNPSDFYYGLRDQVSNTDVEVAARFITINRTCFNGLYRVNSNGKFNVPIGKYKNPVICDEANLVNASNVLEYSEATIQVSDYKTALSEAKENDFIYLDPPYHPTSNTANFTSYTDVDFGEKDQLELAKVFRELNDRKCYMLLSNSNTPFIKKLYADFPMKEVNVQRAINSDASKRTGHTELLIFNYPLVQNTLDAYT